MVKKLRQNRVTIVGHAQTNFNDYVQMPPEVASFKVRIFIKKIRVYARKQIVTFCTAVLVYERLLKESLVIFVVLQYLFDYRYALQVLHHSWKPYYRCFFPFFYEWLDYLNVQLANYLYVQLANYSSVLLALAVIALQ